MGYCYAAMAVQSSREATLACVNQFFSDTKGNFFTISSEDFEHRNGRHLMINQVEDWTILAFADVGVLAELVYYLSYKLKCVVITISYYSSFEHFSAMQNGEPQMVYTGGDDEMENLNVDHQNFYDMAMRMEEGSTIRKYLKDVSPDEAEYYVYKIWNQAICKINLEELCMQVFEMPDSVCYEYETDFIRVGDDRKTFLSKIEQFSKRA